MNNLFIGNLTANVTEYDLQHNFSGVGTVISSVIIRDKMTKISKGFGFVEMETEDAAREAIKLFHRGELDGSIITVREARPKGDDGNRRREPAGGGASVTSRDGQSRGRARY